jgi:hypothetical protein
MASRVKNRWLWRDLRLVYVLLVWAAFGFSIFYFFSGGTFGGGIFSGGIFDGGIFSGGSTLQGRALGPQQRAQRDDEIYTGSIILVPPRGDQCWQMMLDNRTGRMWENGYVNCYVAVRQLADNRRSGAISSIRIQSISDAFRGE